jgi:HEAT repeat protein
VEEEDPNGCYLAQYQRVPARDPVTKGRPASETVFRKTKLKYLASANSKIRSDVYEVMPSITTNASYTGGFDLREGRLIYLKGTETQRFAVAGHDVGQSKTSLRSDFIKSEKIAPTELQSLRLAGADRQARGGNSLSARQTSPATEIAFQQKYLGDATLASLLAALDRSGSTEGESDTQLYLKVRALIYLQPEMSQELGRLLQAGDAPTHRTATLISALGAVGHAEAQAALISAIKARIRDEEMLERLFVALDKCDSPSESTEEALRELMRNNASESIGAAAAQALGGVARKLGRTFPERASSVIDLLIEHLAASTSKDRTNVALLALAATGSERTLSIVAPFLHAQEPDIRATAVAALRSYDAGDADALLLQVLESDPDASVRLESASALTERAITDKSFDAQRKLFATEKDTYVRLALVNNLWQVRSTFPRVLEILKRAGQQDPSKEVQQAVRTLLDRPS